MGVQLNIKDPETVRLARELAGQTRRTVTETVRAALEKMAEERETEVARKKAAIVAAVAEIRADLPEAWRGKTSKQIMDSIYNEDGSFAE